MATLAPTPVGLPNAMMVFCEPIFAPGMKVTKLVMMAIWMTSMAVDWTVAWLDVAMGSSEKIYSQVKRVMKVVMTAISSMKMLV
jgi:hypothetical protein